MIARGEKTIEVRSWVTAYRGPLLICASKSPAVEGLPSGVAVCTVELVDVRRVTLDDAAAAGCAVNPFTEFAWLLANPTPLESPVPVSGKLGLFDVALAS